jgi:hypothetical protein
MPLHGRDGISRRSFLAIGAGAAALVTFGPGCGLDLGSRQPEVIVALHVHEVDGFLRFESSAVSGELFAGDVNGFVAWGATQNFAVEEWDDGFCRFPTFP